MLIISGMILFINAVFSIEELGLVVINKKNLRVRILITGSLVVGGSYFFQNLSMVILITTLLCFLLIEKNSILNSLISIIVVIFIIVILDAIIGAIVMKFIEYFSISGMYDSIARLAVDFSILILAFLISKMLNKGILKLNESGFEITNIFKRKLISIIGCIGIIFIFISNIFVIRDSRTRESFTDLVITFAISYLIIGGIVVFSIFKNVKSEIESKSRDNELKTLTEYNKNLESLYNDMRKFRHDYVNILSSMSGYIEDDDMNGLKEYFNKKIIPLGTDMNEKNMKLGLLHNIIIKEIKGVVLTKMLQAQELGVEITIDIMESIEKVNLDVIDLSRCIGILIDNALEAAVLCENGRLEIGFIKRSNSLMIIIVNSVLEGAPPIHKIFEKGFSTKGKNRGLGLSNLREILSKYPKASLDTVIENKEFRQILEIN